MTQRLENNNTEEAPTLLWRLGTPHEASQLGIWQRVWESPGNLALRVSRICLQAFQRTGGNRDSSLGGYEQKLVHTKTQRRGTMTPWRLNQSYLLVLEGLLWRRGSAGAHHRDGGTGRSPVLWTLLEFAVNPTTAPRPQDWVLGHLRPKTTREGVHPSGDNIPPIRR